MKKQIMKIQGTILSIVFIWLLVVSNQVLASETRLSDKQYVDPKGYFKIIPPEGWRVQEYPDDPRGKVGFLTENDTIDLRVLVNSVDFSTIEGLIASCEDIERRIGINTNIKKVEFGDLPAVQRSFDYKGSKLLYLDFLVGNVAHNIAYSAPKNKFQMLLPLAQKSMETYEPVFKKSSILQEQKHFIAKKKRLAELMIENGNYAMAIQFASEGLEEDPKNEALLKLNNEAKARQK